MSDNTLDVSEEELELLLKLVYARRTEECEELKALFSKNPPWREIKESLIIRDAKREISGSILKKLQNLDRQTS